MKKRILAAILSLLLVFSASAEGVRVRVNGEIAASPVDASFSFGPDADGCRQLLVQVAQLGGILLQLEQNGITLGEPGGEAYFIPQDAFLEALIGIAVQALPEEVHADKLLALCPYAAKGGFASDLQLLKALLSEMLNRLAAQALNLSLIQIYENGDLYITATMNDFNALLARFLNSVAQDGEMLAVLASLSVFEALDIDAAAFVKGFTDALSALAGELTASGGSDLVGEFNLFITASGRIDASFILNSQRLYRRVYVTLEGDKNNLLAEIRLSLGDISENAVINVSPAGARLTYSDSYGSLTELSVNAQEILYSSESGAQNSYRSSAVRFHLQRDGLSYEKTSRIYDSTSSVNINLHPDKKQYAISYTSDSPASSGRSHTKTLKAEYDESGLYFLIREGELYFQISGKNVLYVKAEGENDMFSAVVRFKNGLSISGEYSGTDYSVPLLITVNRNEINVSINSSLGSISTNSIRINLKNASDEENVRILLDAFWPYERYFYMLSGEYVLNQEQVRFDGAFTNIGLRTGISDELLTVSMLMNDGGLEFNLKNGTRTNWQVSGSARRLADNRYRVEACLNTGNIRTSEIRLSGIADTNGGFAFDGRISADAFSDAEYIKLSLSVRNGEASLRLIYDDSGRELFRLCAQGSFRDNLLTAEAECDALVSEYVQDGPEITHSLHMTLGLTYDKAARKLTYTRAFDPAGLSVSYPEKLEITAENAENGLEIRVTADQQETALRFDRKRTAGGETLESELTLPGPSTAYRLSAACAENAHSILFEIPAVAFAAESMLSPNAYRFCAGADGEKRYFAVSREPQEGQTLYTLETDFIAAPLKLSVCEETPVGGEQTFAIACEANGRCLLSLNVEIEEIPQAGGHVDGIRLNADEIQAWLLSVARTLPG